MLTRDCNYDSVAHVICDMSYSEMIRVTVVTTTSFPQLARYVGKCPKLITKQYISEIYYTAEDDIDSYTIKLLRSLRIDTCIIPPWVSARFYSHKYL